MRRIFVLAILLVLPVPNFAQIWVARYNGPANGSDIPCAIAVDGASNVYVTGESDGGGSYSDIVTIKYGANGNVLWIRSYNGSGYKWDVPAGMAIDSYGNVYVAGRSYENGTYDYVIIKYTPDGDTLWIRKYDSGDENDFPQDITVDGSGNVYVTGYSDYVSPLHKYTTIKYTSNGNIEWVRNFSHGSNTNDLAYAIVVDNSGYVYVAGSYTIKYNPTGDTVWTRCMSGRDIAVDSYGNVYVAGTLGDGNGDDYVTIKYTSNGNTAWIKRYNGPVNGDDRACALVVDGSGNVYVTGMSYGSGTSNDYATIKYNSSGIEQWVKRYNGPGNSYDWANAITVDGSGNVYVTGMSYGSGTINDYATIKYNSSGIEQWVKRYNGPGNSDDYAYAITVDGDYVYVTGKSLGSGTSYDYATIKYSCAGVEESGEYQNAKLEIYPNPSPTGIVIKYGLPEKRAVSLRLYDISGRLVKSIYSGIKEKGYYEISLSRVRGPDLPGGVYFIKFEAGKFKATKKLTILR